jgi:cardiolipin synthase
MTHLVFSGEIIWLSVLLIELTAMLRIMLRRHREPESRVAWIVVVAALSLVGVIAYIALGEVRIGRKRLRALSSAQDSLPTPASLAPASGAGESVPERYCGLFDLGRSISGFSPVGVAQLQLTADSRASIGQLVVDIDLAREQVHVLFYIWLEDDNGGKVAAALIRAAQRGVQCRAMVDGLGSRRFIKSASWREMESAGVKLAVALPLGIPVLRFLRSRADLRNHRKLAVIDNRISYCGSQNCADPEFRVKARFAPWVDILVRMEGDLALQNQHVFAVDWMAACGEDLGGLLQPRSQAGHSTNAIAQVIATGPTWRHSAMPELFAGLIHSARRELVITTPYYVPNQSMQEALCACAYRGVETTLILPARNDSWIVAGASRSFYEELLAAGVRLLEYQPGLLHAKTLTVDGEISLIGSANMDRRSLDLNFENNVLIYDKSFTATLRARQRDYQAQSRVVTPAVIASWSRIRRLWNNTAATLSPIL